jgi:hypothetical protein
VALKTANELFHRQTTTVPHDTTLPAKTADLAAKKQAWTLLES